MNIHNSIMSRTRVPKMNHHFARVCLNFVAAHLHADMWCDIRFLVGHVVDDAKRLAEHYIIKSLENQHP